MVWTQNYAPPSIIRWFCTAAQPLHQYFVACRRRAIALIKGSQLESSVRTSNSKWSMLSNLLGAICRTKDHHRSWSWLSIDVHGARDVINGKLAAAATPGCDRPHQRRDAYCRKVTTDVCRLHSIITHPDVLSRDLERQTAREVRAAHFRPAV